MEALKTQLRHLKLSSMVDGLEMRNKHALEIRLATWNSWSSLLKMSLSEDNPIATRTGCVIQNCNRKRFWTITTSHFSLNLINVWFMNWRPAGLSHKKVISFSWANLELEKLIWLMLLD